MKLADLAAADQKAIRRGHFAPAKARAPIPSGRPLVPNVQTDTNTTARPGTWACHACPETFTQWEPAQRHARESGHLRLELIEATR